MKNPGSGAENTNAPRGADPIGDDTLDLIAGGRQFVFKGEGFERDSWFVSFLTKLMLQGSISQAAARPLDAGPQEISFEGRKYHVSQIGNTVYVEELRA